MHQPCWIASASAVSSPTFQCFWDVTVVLHWLVHQKLCVTSSCLLVAFVNGRLLSRIERGRLRLYNDTNALETGIVLKATKVLFHAFCMNFEVGKSAILPELPDLLEFNLFGHQDSWDERLFCFLLWRLKPLRSSAFYNFSVASEDGLPGGSGTFVHSSLKFSALSCIKPYSYMVQFTCCSMSTATGRMKNCLDTTLFTIAFMNMSDVDCRSKHSDETLLVDPRWNNTITIFCRKQANVVLIPFEAALLPRCNMSTSVSFVSVWTCA